MLPCMNTRWGLPQWQGLSPFPRWGLPHLAYEYTLGLAPVAGAEPLPAVGLAPSRENTRARVSVT